MRILSGPIARNSIVTTAILCGRVGVQALALLLTVRLFHPATYGQVVSTLSFAVILGLLPTLGAGFVMLARTPHNPRAPEDIWRYAWPLTALVGCMLAMAYMPLSHLLTDTNPLPWSVIACFAITEIMVTPMLGLISFALQAREHVSLSQVLQSFPFALRLFALLPCFLADGEQRLYVYALSQLFASILALLIAFLMARRQVHLSLKWAKANYEDIKQGLTYVAMHIVAANSTELDKVLATRLVGASEAGFYSVGGRISVALMMPINALLLVAQPRLFRHGHFPTNEGRRLIVSVGIVSIAWGIASGLILLILSHFVTPIFGIGYAQAAVPMAWMSLVAPLMSMRFSASCVLVAIGRPLERMLLEVAGIGVVLTSLFTWAAGKGATGIVFAVGTAEIVMLVLSLSMLLNRYCKMRGA